MMDVVPKEMIEQKILLIRGQKVMLDSDLAKLYGVTTKRLNEQVKRNKSRFPEDFMFRLTLDEKTEVVANCGHLSRLKFSPVRPFAFTEHGAVMAASVLNTQRAADVSIYVVRVFIWLREMLSTHKDLAHKLAELEGRIAHHDGAIRNLIDAIKQLMKQPEPREKKIGFIKESRAAYRSSGKR